MPTIVKSSMTELQKVIAIHDWIVINTDYAYADYTNGTISKYSHTAWGALETGYTVCNGYAELFRLMAAEVGIEAKDISGYGNLGLGDQHHRWSQVKINGKWYNLDLTWDDPTWSSKEHDDNLQVSYNHFLLSDEEFYKQHRPYSENEYYTEKPEVCASSISIPDIIDASVTKRAVYWNGSDDMARFKKDVENITSTNIDYFAVYCMNGDAQTYQRTIDSVVAKTLKKYVREGSELSQEGHQILFYQRNADMLVASTEAECIEMIKKAIEANKKGTILSMRCVNEVFADDVNNDDGDIYHNKDSARCLARLYRWTAKAGINQIFSCISGDGYTEIALSSYNDGREVLVSDSADNALKVIKKYLDSLKDVSDVSIRLICVSEGLVDDNGNEVSLFHYLGENKYLIEYNLSVPMEEDMGDSVYMIGNITVSETNRFYDFDSLKNCIEERDYSGQTIYAFYYDENITESNYKEYMYDLYKNIGSGTELFHTYYVREGVVYIPY